MLYIENIDGYSVRFGNGYGGGDASKVYPKTLQARSDVANPDNDSRIWIWHTENDECVANDINVDDVLLNNTSYATAELFVAAFNALMQDDTPFTTTTTTTAVPVTTTTTTV